MNAEVRVRYAPSPTGYLHVGGVRAFLFNWLYSRKLKGKLILRVEDTDQERSRPEFEAMVLADLKKMGFNYEEGPDVGGPHAPYRQSERFPIYIQHARKLLEQDQAYYCFCSPELITEKRNLALKLGRTPIYDGTCAKIPRATAESRLARGEKAGLRFRVPDRDIHFMDLVRGEMNIKANTVGDFFITRSPRDTEKALDPHIGMPVYNFSCVIDDHLMEMTHIIRGEDHLPNTSKQIMLYHAYGWAIPQFAHTAMVLGGDKQKLSKRNGDVSTREYLDKGYLPEVLTNFLVLLGWWPPSEYKPVSGHPEILSVAEMIEQFSLEGLQKSPAVFDVQKLRWMNSYYLKMLPLSEVAVRAKPFFEQEKMKITDTGWFEKVIDVVRSEAALLSEMPAASRIFFEEVPSLEEDAKTLLTQEEAHPVVEAFLKELENPQNAFDANEIKRIEQHVASVTGCKGKKLYPPIRAITTGQLHGPELKVILPLLGREKVLSRVVSLRRQLGLSQ